MTSFFRYPGGKSKLKNQVISKLKEIAKIDNFEYREPFFGGGSIGLKLLQDNPGTNRIWINDFDPGIACLWTTLINRPDLLQKKVLEFKPSVDAFHQFRTELTRQPPEFVSDEIVADFGFKKLAIHQISYSGLGTKSGSPLGGQNQTSNYKIDCRWSPSYICKKITLLNESFSKFNIRTGSCTNLDFSELIQDAEHNAVLYLDPPYFLKGNDLYQFGFSEEDHQRLAESLQKTQHRWLLSYDDCPEVRELYKWAKIDEIKEVSYSITALKNKETGERSSRTKGELLISNVS